MVFFYCKGHTEGRHDRGYLLNSYVELDVNWRLKWTVKKKGVSFSFFLSSIAHLWLARFPWVQRHTDRPSDWIWWCSDCEFNPWIRQSLFGFSASIIFDSNVLGLIFNGSAVHTFDSDFAIELSTRISVFVVRIWVTVFYNCKKRLIPLVNLN